MIKLGIDLDNTIICYDELIYNLAKKKFPRINFIRNSKSKKVIKNEIIKIYGNEQWTKTFDGGDRDSGVEVQQTTDGGYIIVGDSYDNGDSDVYLIKTDGNGNVTP